MMNKTKNECETKRCQYESATRTRFYNGMLLTAEHLRAEQVYHREALKRVNRNLFGSGIVCGLEVEVQPRGLCVKVHPGVALDCCGNLIEVCNCITVDVSKECEDRYGTDCTAPDPVTSDPLVITKYLVLRYVEKLSDPEQVFTPADECTPAGEKPNSEASKIREGYCIELWDNCPCPEVYEEPTQSLLQTLGERMDAVRYAMRQDPGGTNPIQAASNRAAMKSRKLLGQTTVGGKDCIDLPLPCLNCGCCEDTNAVGLAELKINCTDRTISIEKCNCRRYVISPRLLNWLFSRFPLGKYIPKEMVEKGVYGKLGSIPIKHVIGTAVGFEAYGDTLETYGDRLDADDAKFTANDTRLAEIERRLTALEPQPGSTKPTGKDTVKDTGKGTGKDTAKDTGKDTIK